MRKYYLNRDASNTLVCKDIVYCHCEHLNYSTTSVAVGNSFFFFDNCGAHKAHRNEI